MTPRREVAGRRWDLVVGRARTERFAVTVSVVGVLLLTLIAAVTLRGAEQATDQARLEGTTTSLSSALRTQLERLGGAGTDIGVAVSLVDGLDPSDYQDLMGQLHTTDRFPALYGIALIEWIERDAIDAFLADRQRNDPGFQLSGDGGENVLRIVSHHHPLPANEAAIGLDLSPRGETRVAADRAMETGMPVLSDATIIAQLDRTEPGMVLHSPVPARAGRPPATIAMVLSGQGLVAQMEPIPEHVALLVTDPTSQTFSRVGSAGERDGVGGLTATGQVEVAGQTLHLQVSSTAGFTVPWYLRGSSAILLGGVISALLLGLFVRSIASGERVATQLVVERTRELSELNDRLADSNAALADAGRTKDAFLASVSHELRTPLTVISGFVDAMRRLPDAGHEPSSFLAPIERNVRRLDSLVSDLLTVTSLDARAVTAFRRPVDLGSILPGLPVALAGDDGDVTVSVEPGCVVEVDPRHLDRILVNLLVNARRHGCAPIELVATLAGAEQVEIRVRDHGAGIADTELPRLFQRFARGDDRDNVPGTGLGLSIVRELAELNGGQVVYERAAPGACFVVCLQRAALA